MQLLTGVIGAHKLFILGFYTYIIKSLTPSIPSIPIILACLAQSVHSLTPPSVLVTPVRKLASEFVHPGVDAAVHAAGLNAIREVCRRQIWVMAEGGDEDFANCIVDTKEPGDPLPTPGRREMRDLLEDLVEYKKSKDKGVMVAARGLLGLYREEMPELLRRRERVCQSIPLLFSIRLFIYASFHPGQSGEYEYEAWFQNAASFWAYL